VPRLSPLSAGGEVVQMKENVEPVV